MKIGFFVDSSNVISGINRVVENLASAMATAQNYERIDVVYIASSRNTIDENAYNKVYLGCLNGKSRYFKAIKEIRRITQEREYDSVVFSGMEWGLTFYFALRSSDVRIYAWEHLNFSAGPMFRLEWIGKRLAVKKFDGVINITKRDYEMYKKHFESKYHYKFHQIYNIVKFSAVRDEYNIDSKKIISCGYLSPIKGFDMLVDIAKDVLMKHSDWSWDIYGEGDERANLERLIKEKRLENKVRLKGFVQNINGLYNDYSFFVMTSRKEGMPGVLIEAQRAGLPYISFDIMTGPSETVDDGINGYLIPPFDKQMMAKRIIELIENPEARKKFSVESTRSHAELEKDFIIGRWNEVLEREG